MRVANAAAWRLANAAIRFCVQIIVIAVLARLLPVADFGLIGQVLIIVGLVNVLAQVGMASAIIQGRDLTRNQIETAITLSLCGGLLFMVLAWLAAPLLGVVYRSDACVPIMRAMAPVFLFSAVGAAALAVEQRRLDFRKLLWIDTLAYLLGYGGVGIYMAWRGFGVWSLVGAVLVEQIARALAALKRSSHRPCFPPKIRESRELIRFGFGMSITGVIMYMSRNLDGLLIGRLLGPAPLGFYMRANQLMMTPLSRFSTVMNSVLFPAYAKLQDEPHRLRRAMYQNLQLVALVVFPALVVMAALADEVITVVLGPKWQASVAPLQFLCFAGMLLSASDVGEIVIRAKGEVSGRLKRYLMTAPLMIVAVTLGSNWGLGGAAAGILIVTIAHYMLMAQLALRLIQGNWLDYLGAQLPGAVAAICHGTLALAIAILLRDQQLPHAAVLALSMAACLTAYLLTILTFGNYLLPAAALHALDAYRTAIRRRASAHGN